MTGGEPTQTAEPIIKDASRNPLAPETHGFDNALSETIKSLGEQGKAAQVFTADVPNAATTPPEGISASLEMMKQQALKDLDSLNMSGTTSGVEKGLKGIKKDLGNKSLSESPSGIAGVNFAQPEAKKPEEVIPPIIPTPTAASVVETTKDVSVKKSPTASELKSEYANVEETDDGLTEKQRNKLAIEAIIEFNKLGCPRFGNLRFLPIPIIINSGKETFVGFSDEGDFVQLDEQINAVKKAIKERSMMPKEDLKNFQPNEPEGYFPEINKDQIAICDRIKIPNVKVSFPSVENIDKVLDINIKARQKELDEIERQKAIGRALRKYTPNVDRTPTPVSL